ncbi:hypothetical protein GpartN1_g3239.t1 [Galdieria partita]|uniref:Calcineurin-like phosphoesterase domain-containing protein n=1 Tax=Galdieria partita TaxID=83374 RepID=A0A9C7PV56_9RHOD|nr:hypothetical protein GpartN1_g3239.t1 [Galdieria partita]
MQPVLLCCSRAKLFSAQSLEGHLEYPKLGKKKCKRKRFNKGAPSLSLTRQMYSGFSDLSTSFTKLGDDVLKAVVYKSSTCHFSKKEWVLWGSNNSRTKLWGACGRLLNSSRCLKCRSCSACFLQLEASWVKKSQSLSCCLKRGFSSCCLQQSVSYCVFRSFEGRRTCYGRLSPPLRNSERRSCLSSGFLRDSSVPVPFLWHQLCNVFIPPTRNVVCTSKLFPLMCAVYMSHNHTRPYSHNWKDSNAVLTNQVNPFHSFSSSSEKIRRFAVISDIHVFDVDGFWNENVLEFFNLRILGLLNIFFLRGPERFSVQVLAKAIEDMHDMRVDHLILAGDITNLSLESEFSTASKVVRLFGPPSSITAIPGNHDVYNRGELKRKLFQKYFGSYAVSDIPGSSPRGDGFPIIQVRGNVALIGLNTALPGSARGMVGRRQWHAIEEMMERASHILNTVDMKVLVLHHPAQNPMVRGLPWIREIGHDLKDWKSVAKFCRKYSIDLVVHGHNHVPYQGLLDGSPQTLVCESGSGTLMTYQEDRVARYTIFELNEKEGLERCFARVWDMEGECFRTKELILPPIEKQKSVPFAAT